MYRLAGVAILLSACNQWVRPSPKPEHVRSNYEQRGASVMVESYCDPFEDGTLGHGAAGTGVMVSDWQVLTALHVVDCQSAIAQIRVWDTVGNRFTFVPQREWRHSVPWAGGDDGISLIQMASGDSFRPSYAPPAWRSEPAQWYEPLYVQAAWPQREEVVGEAIGAEYGGDGYGRTFTYRAPTRGGNSGSGIYDFQGYLVGIHMGSANGGSMQYGLRIEPGMVP